MTLMLLFKHAHTQNSISFLFIYNMRLNHLLCIFTLVSMQLSATENPALQPFDSIYMASSKGVPFKVKAHRSLTKLDNSTYRLHQVAKRLFIQFEESIEFRSTNTCLIKPLKYRYSRDGFGISKTTTVVFDHQALVATSSVDGDSKTFAITKNTIDRMSEQLAVQCHVAAGHKEFMLEIADKGKVKQHRFRIAGEEKIELNDEPLNTLKVLRIRKPGSRRNTILWFDPKRNFHLVKLRQEKDGENAVQLELKK